MSKKVSIVIPVFNSEEYIEETINSIMSQTFPNIEVIIVDDGSTDNSGELCDSIAKTDSRINVFHTMNQGPSKARNYGIDRSSGEFILPVDSDDIIAPEYVEKALDVFSANDNIGIVYCKASFFGNINGEWDLIPYSLPEMLIHNCIFATAMFRKCDWEAVAGYSEQMKYGIEDYDFWLSIIELGREVFQIPEILFFYRQHSGSRSTYINYDPEKIRAMENCIYTRHKILYMEKYRIFDKNVKIALYGAGGAGQTYYKVLKNMGNIITCWVDANEKEYINGLFGETVQPIENLKYAEYDYVVVAINKKEIVEHVIDHLTPQYCSKEHIVWYLK